MKSLILIVLMLFSFTSFSQIAINNDGSSPDSKAILDVQSYDKGILIPRVDLDTSPINNDIGIAQRGMMVFNINSSYKVGIGFYYWSGSKWISLTQNVSVMDFDGNAYSTVKIGNKIWMAENLRSLHYSDGSNLLGGATYYNMNDSLKEIYGLLYQWDAIMNGESSSNSNPSGVQGICPNGWHLPSLSEFEELISLVGGDSIGGGPLKEFGTYRWLFPNKAGSNISGFNALPGGWLIFYSGEIHYEYLGIYTWFWSCTEFDSNHSQCLSLYYDFAGIWQVNSPKYAYFSVRCVQD